MEENNNLSKTHKEFEDPIKSKPLSKKAKIAIAVILVAVLIIGIMLSIILPAKIKADREKERFESLQFLDIEIVRPDNGEYLQPGDTVTIGNERQKIEVHVFDKETGERLTVINGLSLDDCCTVYVSITDTATGDTSQISKYWPSKNDMWFANTYFLRVRIEPVLMDSADRPETDYSENKYKYTSKSWEFFVAAAEM